MPLREVPRTKGNGHKKPGLCPLVFSHLLFMQSGCSLSKIKYRHTKEFDEKCISNNLAIYNGLMFYRLCLVQYYTVLDADNIARLIELRVSALMSLLMQLLWCILAFTSTGLPSLTQEC